MQECKEYGKSEGQVRLDLQVPYSRVLWRKRKRKRKEKEEWWRIGRRMRMGRDAIMVEEGELPRSTLQAIDRQSYRH